MLRRTMNADLLNEVANHPDVRPFLGAAELGTLDLTDLVENPRNVALVGDAGGFVYQQLMPGVYELHTLFLPEARGKALMAAARESFRFMFTRTDCLEILTKCPDDNGGARFASSALGFRERFRREAAWETLAGISYRVFSVDDWFVRDPECLAAGQEFHAMVEAAKEAATALLPEGAALFPVHPEDATHDRAAGAACLMAKAGLTTKGAAFYNRWAIFAGYATIAAISETLIDIQDAIIEVRDGHMEVLKCRSEQQSQPQGSAGP
jgi:hypothetical protein